MPDDPYFAGFFDGEGSILIYARAARNGTTYATRQYQIRATITNTNRDVILLFSERFRGSICEYDPIYHKNKRRAWKWTVLCQDAATCLRMLRPLLVVKGAEADIALALQARIDAFKHRNHARGRHGAMPMPPEETLARDDLWRELQAIRKPKEWGPHPVPLPA